MKLKFFGLIIVSFMLLGVANAIPYKWASTTPITYVDISNIQDTEKLDYYLNSDSIVVIYTGNDFAMTPETEALLEYVITSYSIHYTKLYDIFKRSSAAVDFVKSFK